MHGNQHETEVLSETVQVDVVRSGQFGEHEHDKHDRRPHAYCSGQEEACDSETAANCLHNSKYYYKLKQHLVRFELASCILVYYFDHCQYYHSKLAFSSSQNKMQ